MFSSLFSNILKSIAFQINFNKLLFILLRENNVSRYYIVHIAIYIYIYDLNIMIENQLLLKCINTSFIERENIFGETEYLYIIITHNLQIPISFNTIKY